MAAGTTPVMRPDRPSMFWRQLAAMRAEPFAAVPDGELLTRYTASRDEAAFEELARRHGGMVWAVCRQLLPDPADAEDAFQAVFLAFVKSSGRVRGGNVGAWLHGTAVRGAMKLRRGAVRARQRDRATAKPEAAALPGDWNELLAAVHDEVGRLPEALRTAFVVCDLEGVPQPDAATRLGWKAGTLTGRLSKARKRLLDALTKRGLAPAATLGLLGLSAATTSADVPLKLLVTVLNFPSAAPGTIPATLAALSLEIVPMALSKVKLLACAAMLTCGLAAGTGTVLVQVADAQAPGAGLPGGPAPGLPPVDAKPPAVAEVEYKYVAQQFNDTGKHLDPQPFRETVEVIALQSRGGWEFAGSFTARLTFNEYTQRYTGTIDVKKSGEQLVDCTILVFKKPRTPGKSVPVGGAAGYGAPSFGAGAGGPGGFPGGPGSGGPSSPPGGPGGSAPPVRVWRDQGAPALGAGGAPGKRGNVLGAASVADGEAVVIQYKVGTPGAIQVLCERLLSEPAEVIMATQGSVVVLNAKPADIAKLKKVLAELEKTAADAPRQ